MATVLGAAEQGRTQIKEENTTKAKGRTSRLDGVTAAKHIGGPPRRLCLSFFLICPTLHGRCASCRLLAQHPSGIRVGRARARPVYLNSYRPSLFFFCKFPSFCAKVIKLSNACTGRRHCCHCRRHWHVPPTRRKKEMMGWNCCSPNRSCWQNRRASGTPKTSILISVGAESWCSAPQFTCCRRVSTCATCTRPPPVWPDGVPAKNFHKGADR